jgi:hypothetical protein
MVLGQGFNRFLIFDVPPILEGFINSLPECALISPPKRFSLEEHVGSMSYLLSFAAGAMAMWIAATDIYPGVACHPDPVGYFDDLDRR